MNLRIVTDSTCDLPPDIIHTFKLTVIPLYLNFGDQSFLDGVDISRQEFYSNLPTYSIHPTTGTPAPMPFCEPAESWQTREQANS